MKILMDARVMGENPSGIGIYIYNFAKGICDLYPDVEVELVTDIAVSSQIQEFESKGITIYKYGQKIRKNFALIKYYKYVQQVIYESKPDVFWECNNIFLTRIVNPYGKVVTTIHDMFPLTMKGCFGKIYPYYFRYGIHNTFKNVDFIVYNSEETRRDTEKFFPRAKNIPSELLYIVVPEPQKDGENTERKVKVPYYFYIGNLEKRKGSDILIKGFQKYRELGGTKHLYVGGKVREEDIQLLVDEAIRETEGFHYVGYITGADKENYLKYADGFLFPSRAEGFGIPVLEAMEYDSPILLSDLSIFREIVGDVSHEFILDEDADRSAQRMADLMLHMDKADVTREREENHLQMQQVLGRYRAKTLVPKLIETFDGMIKSS